MRQRVPARSEISIASGSCVTVLKFLVILAIATLGVAGAMAATLLTSLGFELWHYNGSFAAAAVGALALWKLWRTRRFTTLMLASSGGLATATGAAMLYTSQFAYKEWLTWWHCFTSVVFTIAFLVHWLHNNPRLVGFTRRLFASEAGAGYTALAAWGILLGLGAWTAAPVMRVQFTRENYLFLASAAIFVGVAFTYGVWLFYRVPRKRATLAQTGPRNRSRALVDTSLFLSNWLALLTGFALLYFADFLRDGDFKYVSKWWHTAASVGLLAFVTLHIGFNARLLAAHARRYDKALE